ncbi:MAG: DUF3021 domain-containing protein [Christensenellaceae bacterium]|nr:DUF3021 domain-containing protein [Christensenellaceae bacterium]
MKKKIILRGLSGIPLGITIGYLITIAASLTVANGHYSAVMPSLVKQFGNEINAVVFQTLMSALIGFGFAATSVIWEIDEWSIAKQTATYFAINALIMLPTAYFAHWMEHSLKGFIQYFTIFTAIFIIIWVTQYYALKAKLKKINKHVNKQK